GDAGSIAAAKLGNFWFILGIRSFDVKSKCKTASNMHIYARMFEYVPWMVSIVKDLSIPF
ncbi:hypothetical protein AVEN_74582-1, partial [Araneus ventricosus]